MQAKVYNVYTQEALYYFLYNIVRTRIQRVSMCERNFKYSIEMKEEAGSEEEEEEEDSHWLRFCFWLLLDRQKMVDTQFVESYTAH